MRKSVKDYAIYFFTIVLGVAVFYVFNAIGEQTAMLNLSKSGYQIIEMLNRMISTVSVFVSIILGFLIIYASRFLIKRRKKEFGIYMVLGMGKGKISRILLCETILIGIISLVIGLVIGVGASQVMSSIVVNIFEADMTDFAFVYSGEATGKTIIYFGIMYLLVMIFNALVVSKCKLIELLQAGKKNECVKIKNPYICIVVFLIAAAMLGYAYHTVLRDYQTLLQNDLIVSIGLGAIGTFLLFWSLSGLVLKIARSMKGIYRKNLNTFVLRQLDSKINTTVFSMTIICLMLFLTIGILSSALAMNHTFTQSLRKYVRADVQFYKQWDLNDITGNEYTQDQIDNLKQPIRNTLEKLGFDVKGKLKDVVDVNTYKVPELTMRVFLGEYAEQLKSYPLNQIDDPEEIIRISDYNKIAKLYGTDTLELNDNQYIVLADHENILGLRNKALKSGRNIEINGKTYSSKYKECKDGFINMGLQPLNIGLIVVPDHAVDDSMRYYNYLIANYNEVTKEGKKEIEDSLPGVSDGGSDILIDGVSRITIYEGSKGLGAMAAFIGIYMGIIFLISGAAILALKELSESSDNKERYEILRRIGADEKMLNRSLFRQIGIFFLFPLVIAIMHSVVGIAFINNIMRDFVSSGMLPSIISTAAMIVIIYGGYFLITYIGSKNIIKDNSR